MSEMAGPFNRGDTVINKHFTFTFLKPMKVHKASHLVNCHYY